MAANNKCIIYINKPEKENQVTSCKQQKSKSAFKASITLDERLSKDVNGVFPKRRQDVLKWYGWGYKDSEFYVKNNIIHFRGDR
ncbi:alkyldihydroxyacetonephosphate synthase-like isoform X2 [Lucilia cuprina]|uniref:alkyldihydroxyacetonephosphate synthase-like isoform X2 n=1 Tax=Lucilia cuprina TaxID=7375 RepID=UPI001F05F961|nr:alkyldihydroxyacetonephosphate synthase-like isoform X2 [Lucilia cuprina]